MYNLDSTAPIDPAADPFPELTGELSPSPAVTARRGLYVPLRLKFVLVLTLAAAWMGFSVWLSQSWLGELSQVTGFAVALMVIAFIAYVPGFMNAFLIGSILSDRRPSRREFAVYPDLCVLVACYNEAENIDDTLLSLSLQDYVGQVEVVVIDDGSTDDSLAIAQAAAARLSRPGMRIRVLAQPRNQGKSAALNRGFAETRQGLVLTVDGDSYLRTDALRKIVQRYLSDPVGTVAVAGAVLVRNSRDNWLTRAQEWDYFHGIAAVKRMQSMYHGTLVAQGAFSLYERQALAEVGGWPECVGEDIVVSWALLATGARIGYCEDACLFTKVPAKVGQFARQRQRWSRGLMEAFARHGRLLFAPRMSTLFIWWNLLFLPLDLVYTLAFLPGLVLALFGYYWIAGLMTLLVLPLAMLWNVVIFSVQTRMFKRQDLQVRRNVSGFLFYSIGYTMLLQPVCVLGYAAELLRLRKTWGTK
ncbi:glycosyltransferase family 2 protein [Pseudoxanthomonas sacheonensis]|uniref:Biofilm PGA synthesis N-glycosyltransferase PgaC n=1 Tax=Pseudoxanthomonas sacheonensis TaxID=443615 RepID=A0ABU1RS48_9GAMM|nr:glycosyltransferase [Pseudoxanthomonas sacheonensis]MDR6841600.1 biofilm PGA synthesis N-glycosyltransferase PgaC [Pseudoxanthomonas sacheonensis]